LSNVEKRYNQEIQLFGKKLRALRTAKALSQLDIEVATGINRTEISRIENGLKNIEFFTVVKLAIALDVPMVEFFTEIR
jgi:transcriptional regulator with XRE-family HTH domain